MSLSPFAPFVRNLLTHPRPSGNAIYVTTSQVAPFLLGGSRVQSMTVSSIKKLLFVCSQNKLRSLTAEKLFEGSPHYQVRSVGTQPNARIIVTQGHLGWADIIFCMEKSHVSRLRRKFPEILRGKRVICLHIPDEFELMDPDLVDEFRAKLAPYVTLPEENPTA